MDSSQYNVSWDVVGKRDAKSARKLELNPDLLEKYISSTQGQQAGAARLRTAKIYQANDRPGYSTENGINELYAGYYDWVLAEKDRLKQHEDYVALSADRPGRKATILGSDLSVAGAGGGQTILGSSIA